MKMKEIGPRRVPRFNVPLAMLDPPMVVSYPQGEGHRATLYKNHFPATKALQ